MMKGNLFVISGPSGTGKGTICKAFIQKHPEVYLSVSATTRQPREDEIEGVHYFFMSEEGFRAEIDRGGFMEHACYCGNFYGTPKDRVFEQLEGGRDTILEIESDGALQIRSHWPESTFIFVCPPSLAELRARLEGRGTETPEVIEERIKKAKIELTRAPKYNYLLLNDTVEAAVARLEAIIEAERCNMTRNFDFINNISKEF